MSGGTKIRIEGAKELGSYLNQIQKKEKVKQIVQANGARLHDREKAYMTAEVAYRKGYSKGINRDNTNLSIGDGGLTATTTTNTNHIYYNEVGTRYMEAEPAVKPAFDEVSKQFIADMRKLGGE